MPSYQLRIVVEEVPRVTGASSFTVATVPVGSLNDARIVGHGAAGSARRAVKAIEQLRHGDLVEGGS